MAKTFNAEEQLFTTKTDWTTEEMKDWLDSTYGENHIERIKDALNQLLESIDNGTIKKNTYGDLNRSSLKAYANKHPQYFKYITKSWRDSGDLYIYIDGKEEYVSVGWKITELIEKLNATTLDERFSRLVERYKTTEAHWLKENNDIIYADEHKNNMISGSICYSYLESLLIKSANHVSLERHRLGSSYYAITEGETDYRPYRYIDTNNFGELMHNGKLVPEEDVEKLLALAKEYSAKATALTEEHKRLMMEILNKGE